MGGTPRFPQQQPEGGRDAEKPKTSARWEFERGKIYNTAQPIRGQDGGTMAKGEGTERAANLKTETK